MKMPLNIRAKPSQNKLSVASKGSGHTDGSASHSRFSRSTKQGKGKQTKVISTPGCRSGLEPGSVSGGLSAQVSKKPVGEGSVSRAGPKKLVVVTDKRDTPDLVATPVSKTLSMENIQSLNAAYGTSSNMYPCERETLEPVGSYPVGTMTVGRNTSHSYSGRATGMGSSPNINSIELNHLSNHYGDQTFRSAGTCSLQRHLSGTHPPTQDLVGQLAPSDLHVQLRELQRENDNLRRELDVGKNGRIGHSMNNVNFCSPDVKRDKGIRREQGARTSALKDFYRDQDQDTIQFPLTVQELQEELRAHREMNSCLQPQHQQGTSASCRELHLEQDHRGRLSPGHTPKRSPSNLHSPGLKNSPRASPSNTYNPRQQEADIIIHSPANTLKPGTRHSPNQTAVPSPSLVPRCSPCQVPGCDGFSSPSQDPSQDNFLYLQSEHERQAKELFLLRKTMEDMEMRIDSQKQTLGARDESIQRLLEMLQGQGQVQGQRGRAQRASILDMAAQEAEAQLENMHVKEDTKISSLERNIRDLEDEVQMLKTSSLLYPDDRQDELKQVEVYKSHSKFMKSKIEQLKQELNRKESEMQALQTKLETLTNQNSDCKQHIEVLKESLNAKEQRANTLQTEVDALRVRLEEKEQFLSKKNKQLQDLTDEKSTLTGEIRDMKDMLDVKERKVNVLQKKIENLLEQLKDKDKQLTGLRDRVQGLQTDSSNTDTALATLEEALSEKERVIENLREQKERVDRVQLEELERMRKENQELKDKLSAIQPQKLSPSQPATPGMNQSPRPDGEVPSKIDVLPVVSASSTAQNTESALRKCPDITDRLRLLEQEVARYREESGKSQAEVERLMGALRDAEVDRSCKEKRINDLERHIKAPHIQKQTVPGELRKDAQTDGQPHSLSQLEDLMGALEKTRQELDSYKLRLCSTQQTLHERDGHLNSLRQERRKQLEEILEMKQQALLAAISEKDANIALLELSSSKRRKAQEEVMALKREKDRLMHQLKQQTQSRMKMMVDNYEEDRIHQQHHPNHPLRLHSTNVHHRSLPRGPPHANHRPPMDQDDEEGIWA
ncbi:ERC protein 2-like isoform X2 [Dunckerocampus dactyliophorus]|uniref:ERC protein 2-like isoform X2 n=1 Tax=Dunckerocampus dactyliophorus TaxID=161453 RepID=UPI002405503A|nr:ERC protein 2-like isoform X2 [Dunckerocampus dactyliophorus]